MCNFAAFAATTTVVVDFQYVTTCRDSTTISRGLPKKCRLDSEMWTAFAIGLAACSDLEDVCGFLWGCEKAGEQVYFLILRRMQQISQIYMA